MSNRIWGLLILWILFWLWYLFYWYYFVYSLVNITFVTNVDSFNISMESTQKNHDFECESSSCNYNSISPFQYSVILKSSWYKDIKYNWKPSKESALQEIDFKKDFKLEDSNLLSQDNATQILIDTLESQKEETIEEKIKKLKEKSQIHLIIEKNDNTYVFKKNNSGMDLFKNEELLGHFEFANKSDIYLEEVIWNLNYLSIILNDKKYLFSIQTGKINEYILEIPIIYIKGTDTNGQFIFVTDKWSFVYDLYKNVFTYNTYFSDFIFFDKTSLVWIIQKDEIEKRNRFEYHNITDKTLIIQFTPDLKESSILLETEKNITKIFKQDGKIYFEDQNKSNFVLSHLEE